MYSLTYVSAATAPFSTAQLRDLLTTCQRRNRHAFISGMLLYKHGNFMQVLEGDEAAVRDTYARIELDPRHDGLILLQQGTQSERQFPEWSMGFVDLTTDAPHPPGYTEFLDSPLTGDEFFASPGRAQRLLLAFKTHPQPVGMTTILQAQVETEKTVMARQIHDELGGFLIASAMDVTNLRHRFAAHDADALVKFDRLARMLNGAIDLMRRLTEELHPTLLDNVGLFAALRWQIKHMAHRSSIDCTGNLPDTELRLHPAVAITLFRAGQEALYVVENQPDVTAVDITMDIDAGSLSMRVLADGASVPPARDSQGGIAWGFLQHRICGLRGEATMSHPPSGGTCLATRVPLIGALVE